MSSIPDAAHRGFPSPLSIRAAVACRSLLRPRLRGRVPLREIHEGASYASVRRRSGSQRWPLRQVPTEALTPALQTARCAKRPLAAVAMDRKAARKRYDQWNDDLDS